MATSSAKNSDPEKIAPTTPSPAERITDIMKQAEQAEIDNDRTQAIELYWEAIAIDNQRATNLEPISTSLSHGCIQKC